MFKMTKIKDIDFVEVSYNPIIGGGSEDGSLIKFMSPTPGIVALEGFNAPIVKDIGILGFLYSPIKEISLEKWGVALCAISTQRKDPDDEMEISFIIDCTSLESKEESDINEYQRKCAEHFDDVIEIFERELKCFVEDPEGLKAYANYIVDTEDSMRDKERKIKEIRDNILVKTGLITAEEAERKARSRR